jgi:hypothetical protein
LTCYIHYAIHDKDGEERKLKAGPYTSDEAIPARQTLAAGAGVAYAFIEDEEYKR